ncbi:MAG: phosphoribosyltransferase domain-containing protein [Blastocatellia bacterium]
MSSFYKLTRLNNHLRKDAITFHFLAKTAVISNKDLLECQLLFRQMILPIFENCPKPNSLLVCGLAESSILLSAIMQQEIQNAGINSYWICSTRRSISGFSFTEYHSHQPRHFLPSIESIPNEVWIVEDEITTGQTIYQLAQIFHKIFPDCTIRFFTLLDCRNSEQLNLFKMLLEKQGIYHSTHTWLNLSSLLNDQGNKNNEKSFFNENFQPNFIKNNKILHWYLPELRPALKQQKLNSKALFKTLSGTLLVIGEAIDLALQMMIENPLLLMQHITLSPWEVDNNVIFNRYNIDSYYLYNFSKFIEPINILSDPIDLNIAMALKTFLSNHGYKSSFIKF